MPSPDACSRRADVCALPASGTAAQARFWIALEQNGPFGRKAATQSRLDPALGAQLEQACSSAGGRFLLIRDVRDHRGPDGRRTAYLAYSGDEPWLIELTLDSPTALLSIDLEALARGDMSCHRIASARPASPVLLMCTNGRRDVCCALRGRPVALAADEAWPGGRVWEAAHLGGHRFAPTGMLLPHGHTFARLTPQLAIDLIAAADTEQLPASLIDPQHYRGRSGLTPAEQAAEGFVRAGTGETGLSALTTHGADHPQVSHRDGRTWQVSVERVAHSEDPQSCGGPDTTSYRYQGFGF